MASEEITKDFYDEKFRDDYGTKAVYLNPNPEHYHQKILEIIEEKARGKNLKILDVGCATGYLGAAIKQKGEHRVYGIEISEVAAKHAEKLLDYVICGNIESIELHGQEDFDIILLSDVLEHLFDPRRVLIKLKEHVETDGIVLAVMPNVAHYSIRLMLLRGRWAYQNVGSLDYGHLRFFTKKTGLKMFEDAGYRVIQVIPFITLPLPLHPLTERLNKLLLSIFRRFLDNLFASNFLYISKPL